MYTLVRTSYYVFADGPEPCLEISDRIAVRIIVVNSQSSSEIDVSYGKPVTLEVGNNFIDPLVLSFIFNAINVG